MTKAIEAIDYAPFVAPAREFYKRILGELARTFKWTKPWRTEGRPDYVLDMYRLAKFYEGHLISDKPSQLARMRRDSLVDDPSKKIRWEFRDLDISELATDIRVVFGLDIKGHIDEIDETLDRLEEARDLIVGKYSVTSIVPTTGFQILDEAPRWSSLTGIGDIGYALRFRGEGKDDLVMKILEDLTKLSD